MELTNREYLKEIINLTKDNIIQWQYMDDQDCFASSNADYSSAICKCNDQAGKAVFIYSDTDEDGLLLEDVIELAEDEADFPVLKSLYEIIQAKVEFKNSH